VLTEGQRVEDDGRVARDSELAERVGITMANISILKNGKAKAIRLSTLDAICQALDCQPGDVLEYREVAGVGGK
jgi:putative transcriptional regulator